MFDGLDYVDNDAHIIPDGAIPVFNYPAKPKHPTYGMQISEGTALLEVKGTYSTKS